ncbi:MAG: protein kinase [Polyangiaceae bacterium]
MAAPISPRYQVLETVGRGGMGHVELVLDTERGERVARKRLRSMSAMGIRRLKREFRTLVALEHEHLVRLYELGEDESGTFYTMEWIDGADLTDRLASLGPRAFVLDVLPSLLSALVFLHGAGLVHGDLKPGNVRLRRDGAVKLLDFGLAAAAGRVADETGGTPRYMAPEVHSRHAASPLMDAYALGVMLFEACCGRPPTTEAGGLLDRDAQAQILAATAGVHETLAAVCLDLLEVDPARRLLVAGVAARLGDLVRVVERADRAQAPLLGREAAMQSLRAWLHDKRPLGVVLGPSGIGKTRVLDTVIEEHRRAGGRALTATCRPEERIAFNAIDEVVDRLVSLLPREDVGVNERAQIAAWVFPVLAEVAGIDLDKMRARARTHQALFGETVSASREDAFGALIELFGIAAQDGLLIGFDDFHWADEDSIAFVERLSAAHIPGLTLLATLRDDVGQTAALHWALARADLHLVLPPLAGADLLAIAQHTAHSADPAAASDLDESLVAKIAGGRPALAEACGRGLLSSDQTAVHTAPELESVVAALVAADDWIDVASLAQAASASPGEVIDRTRTLERRGLVRRSSDARRITHDTLHVLLRASLPKDSIVRAHGALADLSLRAGRVDGGLVRHLLAARREQEAGRLAVSAARDAEARAAHSLAADLYDVALEHGGGDLRELLPAQAASLEHSARYAEAARCHARRAELAGEASREQDVIDARLAEAHALLAGNDVSRGADLLEQTQRHWFGGGKLSAVRDLWAGIRFLRGPAVAKSHATPSNATPSNATSHATPSRATPSHAAAHTAAGSARRELKLAMMVSFYDPLAGVRLLQRARDRFDATGARREAAWCDFIFSHFAQYGTDQRGEVLLSTRYRESARRRLAHESDLAPELRAMDPFLAGVDALRAGTFSEAIAQLEDASEILESAGLRGTFEHMMVLSMRCQLHFFDQDPAALEADLLRYQSTVRASSDTAFRSHLYFLEMGLRLLQGRFDDAREVIRSVGEVLPANRPTIQRFVAERYEPWADVYDGDVLQARVRFRAASARGRRFRVEQSMFRAVYCSIGGLLEAAALRLGERSASLRRVRALASRYDRSPPLMEGVSLRTLAYAADAQGSPARALELLQQAEARAEAAGRRIDVATARFQRGLRLGGDEGRRLVDEARTTVTALGSCDQVLQEDPVWR